MGTVECFQVEGVRLWFPSLDHAPPHLHAKRDGEWECRIWFMEGSPRLEMKWSEKPMSAAHRRAIVGLAAGHRLELFAEWERKVRTA